MRASEDMHHTGMQARARPRTFCSDSAGYLFPDLIKYVDAFVHFLERPVNFCLKLSVCAHDVCTLTLGSLAIMRNRTSMAKL